MKPLVLLLSLALTFPGATVAKEKKIRGYVTNVISPTSFEIEDYRITRDTTLVLEFEKDDADKEPIDFRPEDVRVGTEVEIRGEYNEQTGELRAKSIKVFLEEFRKVKRTALIERAPLLKRSETGWEGTFFADGQRIQVGPSSKVLFKPSKSEAKILKSQQKAQRQTAAGEKQIPDKEESDFAELESLDQISPNTFMAYEGLRQPDGTIAAARVEFMRNELEKGEAKLWKDLTPKTKEPDFIEGKPANWKWGRREENTS